MSDAFIKLSTLIFGGAVFAMLASALLKKFPKWVKEIRSQVPDAKVIISIVSKTYLGLICYFLRSMQSPVKWQLLELGVLSQ